MLSLVTRAGLALFFASSVVSSAVAETAPGDLVQSGVSLLSAEKIEAHFPPALSEAITSALATCKLGHGKSCFLVAGAALAANGPSLHAAGRQALSRSCALDFGPACEQMAWLERDERARYFDQACALGMDTACVSVVSQNAEMSAEDRLAELETICADGLTAACSELGAILSVDPDETHSSGLTMTRDLPRAFQLFTDACMFGDGRACYHLSAAVDPLNMKDGWDQFPKDHALSTELLQVACDVGEAMGCRILGHRFEHGEANAPLDLHQAWDYQLRACEMAGKCAALARVAGLLDQENAQLN